MFVARRLSKSIFLAFQTKQTIYEVITDYVTHTRLISSNLLAFRNWWKRVHSKQLTIDIGGIENFKNSDETCLSLPDFISREIETMIRAEWVS